MYSLVLHLILTLLQIFLHVSCIFLFRHRKEKQPFFGYLRIRSQILDSEIATFLILMQVHLRGHVRISIQIDIFCDVDACYELQRDGENNGGKGKNEKRFWQRCVRGGVAFPFYFVRHVMRSNLDGYALLRPVITIVIITTLDLRSDRYNLDRKIPRCIFRGN